DAGQGMDAVAAADIVEGQVGTAVHQQLNHVVTSLVRRTHQRGAAVQGVLSVDVRTQVEQEFDGVVSLAGRPLVSDALDPADAARDHQRGHVVFGGDVRISSVLEQQFHQYQIA